MSVPAQHVSSGNRPVVRRAPRSVPVRVDALRNRERILDAASLVLRERPQATMPELARAADIGRATLYRHFAGRVEIIDALRAEVVGEATAMLRGCLGPIVRGEPGAQSVAGVFDRLVKTCLAEDSRYRDVMAGDPARSEELVAQFRTMIQALVRRGQGQGEFTTSVPAEVLAKGIEGIIAAALHGVASGHATMDQALELNWMFFGAVRDGAKSPRR